jgi:hypothetical protein
MKTKLASILVLAAALCASFSASLSAAPKTAQAHAVRVRTVDADGWEISRGMSAKTLVNRFGAPDTKLSENVWVYHRFVAVPNHPQTRECKTLVVTFVEGVVSDLHLVNDRAQAIITARVQSGSTAIVATAE